MTRIIAECGLNWRDPDEARDLGKACLAAGADFVKYQLLTDPYRTARDRGMEPDKATEWARMIPRMNEDEWRYVFGEIPREQRMVSVFSPSDILMATWLRVDNIKIGHKEHRLIGLAREYARELWVTNFETDLADHRMMCVEKYPCSYEETIHKLRRFAEDHPVRDIRNWANLSDHTGPNLDAAKYALTSGAGCIEIHVHLPSCGGCLDHLVSKSPEQLRELAAWAHK